MEELSCDGVLLLEGPSPFLLFLSLLLPLLLLFLLPLFYISLLFLLLTLFFLEKLIPLHQGPGFEIMLALGAIGIVVGYATSTSFPFSFCFSIEVTATSSTSPCLSPFHSLSFPSQLPFHILVEYCLLLFLLFLLLFLFLLLLLLLPFLES